MRTQTRKNNHRCRAEGFQPLAITMRHALFVYGLPDIHKDPFDRMIVAQSILEEMPLLTKDGNIPKYGIQVIW